MRQVLSCLTTVPDASADRGIDTMKRERVRPRRELYRIRVSFGVPLAFAFAWCTDYTPEDASLEGDSYQRKIVERTPRQVIFEDLEESDDGWNWSRDVVTLRPPNRWHMDGVGNRRDVTADYVLSPLPDGRTRFDLRWSRRASPGTRSRGRLRNCPRAGRHRIFQSSRGRAPGPRARSTLRAAPR